MDTRRHGPVNAYRTPSFGPWRLLQQLGKKHSAKHIGHPYNLAFDRANSRNVVRVVLGKMNACLGPRSWPGRLELLGCDTPAGAELIWTQPVTSIGREVYSNRVLINSAYYRQAAGLLSLVQTL